MATAPPPDPRILALYVVLTTNADGTESVATLGGKPMMVPVRSVYPSEGTLDDLRHSVAEERGLSGKALTITRFVLRDDLGTIDRREERRTGRKVLSPFG